MEKNNGIEQRQKELTTTGLCNIFDFKPEKKTRIENYTFNFKMDKQAKNMLEMAHRHFELVDSQLERIEKITLAILKIDNKEIAEPYHIAEALQYVT